TFTLAIDAPGFKHYRETGVALDSSEQRSLGVIRLQIGQATESVTIAAEAVTVNLASGERSGTLDSTQLDHLALRGRDVFDAISLMAGVVDTSDGRDAPGPTSIGNIYILGGRNDSKNMTIDGVTNLDTGSNGSVHSMPSMDSIAEVKVLMSAYSAESGRNPSSINVITKGGGKQFHGTVGWFFRNEDLNANDYFNNLAGKPRPESRFNIANYSVGGPVILPKLSRDRKLFFFVNQEFQHTIVPYGTKTVTVPTALERQGDFSKSYNTNCSPITIKDPLNGQKAFPGNIIPPSRLTTTGQAILNIFPLPNYVDPNPSRACNYNYFSSLTGAYPRRTETGRVDYSPKDNWQLYVSLSNNADSQNTPYTTWVTGSLNFPLTPIVFKQPGRLATMHSTNVITPSLFNEVSVAVSQNTLTFTPLDVSKVDRTKLGVNIPQRNPSLNPLNIIPDMTFSSVQNAANPSLNDGTPYFNQNTIYSVTDNVSKIKDTHTFKVGVYFEHTQKIQSASPLTRGSINFNTDGNNPNDSNNAYSNALLGNFDTYAEATARPKGNFLFSNLELYLQDSWRVTHSLSLDFGVRFYHDPPQYEGTNQLASFSRSAYDPKNAAVLLRPATVNGVKVAQDPLSGQTYPFGLVGSFVPGAGNPADGDILAGVNGAPRGLYTVAPWDIAPRFGFAWDPIGSGKTAVRGGAGIYFDRIEGNPVMGQIGNPPLIFSPTQYYGTFADIQSSVSSGLLSPNGSVTSLAGNGHQQAVYNFSMDIQRQIGRSDVIDIGYTGSMARHLLWQRNINPVPLGSNFLGLNPQNRDPTTTSTVLAPNFLRPYQGAGDILLYEFAGTSNYHGLLASYAHRWGSKMNVNLSYTFSKALDESDSYSSQVDAFVSPRSRNYGRAGFDRNQTF
ncbi:MAG: TonB-dependent receptor, partial [Bryobacterales bacterium]|nr:TonB-dependent receptor [Bryobacterales bacterium]